MHPARVRRVLVRTSISAPSGRLTKMVSSLVAFLPAAAVAVACSSGAGQSSVEAGSGASHVATRSAVTSSSVAPTLARTRSTTFRAPIGSNLLCRLLSDRDFLRLYGARQPEPPMPSAGADIACTYTIKGPSIPANDAVRVQIVTPDALAAICSEPGQRSTVAGMAAAPVGGGPQGAWHCPRLGPDVLFHLGPAVIDTDCYSLGTPSVCAQHGLAGQLELANLVARRLRAHG